ncbi:DUF72 domain-containing protein [Mesorhizobium sp.]|uniref:DUF72 domain-containing protein n=1 Tax=Mesorhizobium sp. TaxID=1871066 RepID=UPI003BAA4241
MDTRRSFIGTAGWGIPARHKEDFPQSGSHLERYALRLPVVEIDTSFYKPHRRETYERWNASVPERFRFAVKTPKAVTHERRLVGCEDLVEAFLLEVGGLGAKLGVLVVQLPPSLRLDPGIAESFFHMFRERTGARLACEPRHASWFTPEADALLAACGVARIAADPATVPSAALPGGWPGLAYFRLHGAPRTYYSDYEAEALAAIRQHLETAAASGAEVWCIFDNTAEGHALGNALAVDAMIA